jgi:uncharacterized phage infection (PIP) family protein YhgE
MNIDNIIELVSRYWSLIGYGILSTVILSVFYFLNNKNMKARIKEQEVILSKTYNTSNNINHEIRTEFSDVREQLQSGLNDVQNKLSLIEREKVKGLEEIRNMKTEVNKTIQNLNDTEKKVEGSFDKSLKEFNEKTENKFNDIENSLKKKLESEIDKSKIRELSKKMDNYDKNIEELKNIKHDSSETHKVYQRVIEFLEYALKDVKLNKKKREEYEQRINELRMKLSRTRGEEYNQTLQEYKEMKENQNEE